MRLNEDTQIYRQTTALYLNLLLDARTIHNSIFKMAYPIYSPYEYGNVDLFHFMVAIQPTVQTAFLCDRKPMPASHLSQLCAETLDAIHVRCAGLVEMLPTRLAFYVSDEYASLEPQLKTVSHFIHRTAYDFLMETEEGHNIRAHDPSSETDRRLWLVRGYLVKTSLFSGDGYSYNIVWSALIPLSLIQDAAYYKQQQELFQLCWEWYDSGHLRIDHRNSESSPPHFLAVAASPQFKDFIQSSIVASPNPSLLATSVLRDMAHCPWLGRTPYDFNPIAIDGYVKCLLEPLLSLGADPRRRGFCHRSHPGIFGRRPNSIPFMTPLGCFLQQAIGWPGPQREFYDVLSTLLKDGGEANERFPLVLCVAENEPQWQWDSVEQVSSLNDENLNRSRFGLQHWRLVLDVSPAFAINVLWGRSIRNSALTGTALPTFTYEHMVNLRDRDAPIKPVASVALVVLPDILPPLYEKGSEPPLRDVVRSRIHRPLKEDVSDRLMASIEPWLSGDKPKNWPEEIRQSLSHVALEIDSGSKDYRPVDGPVSDYLAEIGCGYRFVDEEHYNRAECDDGDQGRAGKEDGDEGLDEGGGEPHHEEAWGTGI